MTPTPSDRRVIFCTLVLCLGDVLSQRIKFQKYRYDPWTGRTSSVEEFDEDVRNMDSRQLSKYMSELRKVKNTMDDMRRESEILERELGFGLGGFPMLMDNSENIIRHALDSVTDQLQRRIGHHVDPKMIDEQKKFDEKMRLADRSTLQRNLEKLQQTKREITEAKEKAKALKNEMGFDFEEVPGAMKRAEKAIDRGMEVINHRLQNLDHPHTSHPQLSQDNVTNTMRKVDNVVQTADKRKLAEFGNEFKKMKRYMDDVRAQLDTFHRDIGFEFDGVFEPFKMAESILNRGLDAVNQRLLGYGSGPAHTPSWGAYNMPQQPGPQQAGPQQGAYQQPYPAGGPQQGPYQQPYPAGGPQQGPYQQPHPAGGPQQGGYQQPHPAGGPQQGASQQPNPAAGPQQGTTTPAATQQTQATTQNG